MENTIVKSICATCEKQTRTFSCKGCSKEFCRNDFTKHFDSLDKQLDQITNEHNEIVRKISMHKRNPDKSPLLDKINRWEEESIEKIHQIAREYRNKLVKTAKRSIDRVENQLEKVEKKLKQIREENDFNEIDLKQCQEKLKQLENQLENPTKSLIQRSTALINQMPSNISSDKNSKWKQNGVVLAGNGQLDNPGGICVTDDQTLYVADRGNHRIMQWKPNAKQGRIVVGNKTPGQALNQLNNPNDVIFDKKINSLIIADQGNQRVLRWSLNRKDRSRGEILITNINCSNLAIDQDGSIYISDNINHNVRKWKKGEHEGTIVAGGNGHGDRLNQLDNPTHLFIDHEYSLYVTDDNNCRVMKWIQDARRGIPIVSGTGPMNRCDDKFCEPAGLFVNCFKQIFIVDSDHNRIARLEENENTSTVIVDKSNIDVKTEDHFNGLSSITFDSEGNLYVSDSGNNRVLKFEIDFD